MRCDFIRNENRTVDPGCQGLKTSEEGSLISALILCIVIACIDDFADIICYIYKSGKDSLSVFISGSHKIPSTSLIGLFNSTFKDYRHSSIHRPADVENLNKPIHMFKYVDILRKAKRIKPEQWTCIRIRAKDEYISIISENVFVFSFCRFYNKKLHALLHGFVEKFINSIAFSGAGTSCDESMCAE